MNLMPVVKLEGDSSPRTASPDLMVFFPPLLTMIQVVDEISWSRYYTVAMCEVACGSAGPPATASGSNRSICSDNPCSEVFRKKIDIDVINFWD